MIGVAFSSETTVSAYVMVGLCVIAIKLAGIRWLRVGQREHYLAGSVGRFFWRWWREPRNAALLCLGVAGVIAAHWCVLTLLATAIVVGVGPLGLSLKGRTSPLVYTRRLRLLIGITAIIVVVVIASAFFYHRSALVSGIAALLIALIIDLALVIASPIEARLLTPFVKKATATLSQVNPIIVGITGSYGKTSTKNHVATLLGSSMRVVVTPASFNNRAGLARAINEGLTPGTELFVAEMGIYGPGEIASLVTWCPPSISVITAIGPVHLERMGTLENIARAKVEITQTAHTVILNADAPLLASLAEKLRNDHPEKKVVLVSASDSSADVCVTVKKGSASVYIASKLVASDIGIQEGVSPSNLACALAVALALNVDQEVAIARLGACATTPHRLSVATAPSGVVVVDDTFNANPAGARAGLDLLCASATGRRVLITPGMIELGSAQFEENAAFARLATERSVEVGVVGHTNKRALLAGAKEGICHTFSNREAAVAWVRANLGPTDGVFYENDLPDHYP
jgi:UDP-N-acetylmuramoyl-tripeptide--D-alanyl-D-alanine ligase